MTDGDLKKLKRGELLEMLISQMEENIALKERLLKQEQLLKSREIAIDNAGSIAEAALGLNEVFDAAEKAAQQYLENIQCLNERQDKVCKQMELEARKKASEIIDEAKMHQEQVHTEAEAYSAKKKKEADAYWDAVNEKVRVLLEQSKLLQGILYPQDRGK